MECNKTPSSDGLPAEFYKVFWNDIADFFLKSINQAYHAGQLSVTQRRGIIKLIPKKDAEPYLIKNWRPISLLNCDYKIAAKAIANRFKHVLPDLIDNDQTGFLKGRFIGENIRLVDGVIKHAAAKNIPGLLLFLDFEKAFDTVEWSFIQKTLKHFNFGPSTMNWIRLFYHNTESCILNNGWSSAFFKLGNAIHESITDTFLKTKKPNRLAYKILVSKKQKRPITAQTKWIADCTLETQEIIDWKTVYRTPFLCTKITKIIVFQFKLLHRRLATNSFLTKINLKDNEQCTFCQNDKETLIHLFWTCEISTLFWEGFKQWAINRGELSNNTNLSPYLVLGLKPNKNKSINFYFLIARYFIWICKMRSLSPKINLKDNEQCTFCQNDKETLIHLFWTCEISTLFWEGFKQWAINRGELSNNTNLSPYLVLGLKPNKNKSINFYFLIARYFIWICKMRSLSPKIENFFLFLSHYDITKTFS